MTANQSLSAKGSVEIMSTDRVHQVAGRVRRLYRLGSARWYDPFRALWARLTSRAAEAELDRLVCKYAVEGCRVLDIGCGTGHNLGRLQRLGIPFWFYRGVDFTDSMLDVARERYGQEARATFDNADLYSLTDESGCFDLVLCTWVASHLEQPRDVFELAYRLMAPGGHALFLTLTRPHWCLAWWFTSFVRLFQARYVEPEAFVDLPGLATRRTWAAGLTTLVQLEKAQQSVAA